MQDYTHYFQECHKHLSETEYLSNRGIDSDLLAKFNIGFDPQFQEISGHRINAAVIIPTSPNSYVARNTDSTADTENRYLKSPGSATCFNIDALRTADGPIFITEGEIDALSIMTAGGEAISLGRITNARKLISCCDKERPRQPLLIALDNDEAGLKASAQLYSSLSSKGIACQIVNICEGYKDPNEALMASSECLKVAVANAIAKARKHNNASEEKVAFQSQVMPIENTTDGLSLAEELHITPTEKVIDFQPTHIPIEEKNICTEDLSVPQSLEVMDAETAAVLESKSTISESQELAEYNAKSCVGQIKELMESLAARKERRCMKTGFNLLDVALEGGLYEGVHMIGAMSSLGKTTFVLQICDNIAKTGNDVLFFSLEMSPLELIAKNISRISFTSCKQTQKKNCAATSREILDGVASEFTEAKNTHIRNCADTYSQYASRIFIVEGTLKTTVSEIEKSISNHIMIRGKSPVVVIDYFQLIRPTNPRADDKQTADTNMTELKRLGRELHVPIIAISSLNRASYDGPVDMKSCKESGSIEFSTDVLIGLQYSGVGKKGFSEQDAKAKIPREIELVLLKARSGPSGYTIAYNYFARYNTFEERQDQGEQLKGLIDN